MSTNAAEHHYNWRVELGHHYRAANWMPGCKLLWDKVGHGCLIHPRIVLTSLSVWEKAERNRHGYNVLAKACNEQEQSNEDAASNEDDEADEPNEIPFQCQLGFSDKARDLAALVSDRGFQDSQGKELTTFPEVADGPPLPGQPLSVLTDQYLHGGSGPNWDVYGASQKLYTCFSYGYVSLLRSEDELLFALSGILTDDDYPGAAVFDSEGKIYGVVTSFLKHWCDPTHRDAARGSGRFVVFSSIYKCRTQMLRLPTGGGLTK